MLIAGKSFKIWNRWLLKLFRLAATHSMFFYMLIFATQVKGITFMGYQDEWLLLEAEDEIGGRRTGDYQRDKKTP